MAKLLKLRRGTTSQHSSFTGAEGEVTVDTDKETLVVHDGSTAGGHPVAAEDMANVSSADIKGRLGTTITNAEVNASAAIAGTKISPDFGSQNITTTGGVSCVNATLSGELNLMGTENTKYMDFNIGSNLLVLRGTTGGDTGHVNMATFARAGSAVLNYNGTNHLATNSTGVAVTGNINVTGTATATTFSGSGASLTNLPAANLTGTLPALDGSNLTGIAGIPSGVIAMWSGATSAIPTGWVLCDGNNSTPDLRDRFVLGATAGTGDTSLPGVTPGATGGAFTGSMTVSVNGNTGWASQYANASSMPNASPEPFNSRDRHQHSWGGNFSHTYDKVPPYYALAFIMKS